MPFVQLSKCLSDPKQLIRLIVLIICVCFTINQLSQCVDKLLHPKVSTYYKFYLNESIIYPTVTICRKPAYKTELFSEYGLDGIKNLYIDNAFANFNFSYSSNSVHDFLGNTTYSMKESIALYGFGGKGSDANLGISSKFYISHGRCYIISPRETSRTFSEEGGYFFKLKHDTKEKTSNIRGVSNTGYEIYLHDPSEVLTDQESQDASFMEYIYLEAGEEIKVILNVQNYQQVATKKSPCVTRANYSKSRIHKFVATQFGIMIHLLALTIDTVNILNLSDDEIFLEMRHTFLVSPIFVIYCHEECIHNQIAEKIGCTLPWLRIKSKLPQCNNYYSVKALISGFNEMNSTSFLNNCDCSQMRCKVSIYTSQIQTRKEINSYQYSAISLFYKTNVVTQTEEIISYDWNNFLSDIGGSLGFLLGLSVIGMIEIIEQMVSIVIKRVRKMKNKRNKRECRIEEETNTEVKAMKKIMDYLSETNNHGDQNLTHI